MCAAFLLQYEFTSAIYEVIEDVNHIKCIQILFINPTLLYTQSKNKAISRIFSNICRK